MKSIFKYSLILLLASQTVVFTSCEKEEDPAITLQGSGEHKVTVMNGTAPVANAKARLYKSGSSSLLDVFTTDANGVIDFGKLIEGNYEISIEVKSPKYVDLIEEFQVVSGQRKESTLQVEDHTGSLTVFALNHFDKEQLVQEDLGLGIALIPRTDEYSHARTNQDKNALRTAIQYFGAEGKAVFENLPTATYDVYTVHADTLVNLYSSYSVVSRGEEKAYKTTYIVEKERLFNKASWGVRKAQSADGALLENFPVESIRFSRSNTNTSSRSKFTILLNNGVTVKGDVDLGFSNNGASNYFYLYNSTADMGYSVRFSTNGLSYDEAGNLVLGFDSIRVTDEEGSIYYSNYNFEIVLN